MKNKLTCFVLLFLMLCIGVYIRVEGIPNIMTSNTVAFFYARARDLHASNHYPLEDSLNYAPETLKEDYPPFPAYFAVYTYKVINLFYKTPFYKFIVFFPVLMYVLIFVTGFFIIANLYNKITGFFFTALLTIMPTAFFLTKKGYYTEEALGVFLILLFFFSFIKSEKNRKYTYLAITALTLLSLTWQIFVWVVAGILANLAVYRKKLVKHLLILILPLLIGHIISVNLIGLDYSPVQMFKEAYIGYKYSSSEDFEIALHRGKLNPMDFQRYIKEYAYIGLIFSALGLFICLKNLKKHEYSVLFIYSILGFVAISKYIKFRFFSLVFILVLSSLGLSYAYSFDWASKLGLEKHFKKLNLKKYYKKIRKVLLLGLLVLIGLLIMQYLRDPKCEITLTLPEQQLEIGEVYDIVIDVENVGKGALCTKDAFSGLHIEVENANITRKKAYSSMTSSEVVEKGYTMPGIEWFETKFDCLKHNGKGRVTFSIKPYAKPVKINYRCWIPQFCFKPAPKDMLPEYKMAWRNENCLHREPSEGELCSVLVYAGYEEKQEHYCTAQTIY